MGEDLELNGLVRSALEAPPPFAWNPPVFRRRAGVFRRFWPWAAASLVAASVALTLALALPGREDASPVEDALRLLTEAEGVEPEDGDSASSADLLVAWQGAVGA